MRIEFALVRGSPMRDGERMKRRSKAELLAWIEQHQPVTWIMSGCRTGSVNFNASVSCSR